MKAIYVYNQLIFKVSLILIASLLMRTSFVQSQTVPVGMPFFEDNLRRAQLMGKVDADVSFMIRPVDPVRAFGIANPFGPDELLYPTDSVNHFSFTNIKYQLDYSRSRGFDLHKSEKTGNLQFTLLPVYLHTRYNHHHPYGWSDGPMVPAKGLQQYLSGGVYIKALWFEAQFRPEYVWAQNKDFQNPPFRARNIHMPERMGQETYTFSHIGQSFVKLHIGPMAVGYSNENLWWGPGRKNSIVMTNNAPGFGHFTLHTNRPIKTRYGTFEGQMVSARLRLSGFTYPRRYQPGNWPPIAGDVVPDTVNGDGYHGYMTTMAAVYQPIWVPGLFFGVSRVVYLEGDPRNWKDYIRYLYTESRGEETGSGPEEGGINRNQIVSIFSRYLFKEANAEIYFEAGRQDWWFDLEDLFTRPSYATVYMAGFRKMHQLKGEHRWLEIMSEYTKIQAPIANYVRPNLVSNSFYAHGTGSGWSHRGQVLGAGIGPGSNMFTIGGTYINGMNSFGIHYERVAYNLDMMYNEIDYLRLGFANPFFIDASKGYVDWGILLNYHTTYGKLAVGYQLHLLRTYNFQWNYDPFGAPGIFRFPGINVWSVNGELSLVYRF